MKLFPSTNFHSVTIKITAINFSNEYGLSQICKTKRWSVRRLKLKSDLTRKNFFSTFSCWDDLRVFFEEKSRIFFYFFRNFLLIFFLKIYFNSQTGFFMKKKRKSLLINSWIRIYFLRTPFKNFFNLYIRFQTNKYTIQEDNNP